MSTLMTDRTYAGSTSTATIESPLDGHVTRRKLAQLTGKSQRFWYRMEVLREGPPIVRLGITPMYRLDGVREWLKQQEQRGKARRRA
jgi:hypothetical protein